MEKSTFKRRLMFVVCMLMCGLSIQAADDGLITDQIIIDKLVAGTLLQRISSDEKNLITNLKINGEINGTDLRLIREMAGPSVQGGYVVEGHLSILDLSDARIVSGGDYYYQDYDYWEDPVYHFTKENEIGYNAFSGCDRLTSVTLPSCLTEIGYKAFSGCYNLTNVTFPSCPFSIGYEAFAACGFKSLTLPPNLTIKDSNAFSHCQNLTSVTFSSGFTLTGNGTFLGCGNLANVTFPSSLTSIGDNAFSSCGFKTLTLPPNITRIGESAFYSCENLKSLTLSPSLTSIGDNAFAQWDNLLRTLTIPSGLTSIDSLMYGITDFDRYIPHSIFPHKIRTVYVAWQTPIPAGRFFDDFYDLSMCTLYVPLGTKQAYSGTEVWREFGEIKEYDVSGVDKVDNHSEAKEVSRYSLDGQLLFAPVKGLNIVRYSDGSIKKVVVN